MKKNRQYLINNQMNKIEYNLNNSKITPKNKIKDNKNSSNLLKDIIRNIDTKSKINKKPLQYNACNLNSTYTSSIPYHYILNELMKYLEIKIKPKLYKEVNNYLNSKINDYFIEKIDNKNIKKTKLDLNQDKNKKRNNEANAFSSKKYKSYLNFNIFDKNKQSINKNNYILTQFQKYKKSKSNSIKKEKLIKKNFLVSTDYLHKRRDILGKRQKIGAMNNNRQNKICHTYFENYYKGSSENIKHFSYENKSNENNNSNNEINNFNICKKIKPSNKNNLKLNKKLINNSLRKDRLKYNNKNERYINNKNINQNKSHSKDIYKKNIDNYNLNLNISSSQSKNKSYNINNQNNKIKNNSYIRNEYRNNNSNNNLRKQNITINLNLTQRPFLNKMNILNDKLINKLKISMNSNNNASNSIEKKFKKPYNLKNYEILTRLTKKNNINNNNLFNKGLINKANKKFFLNKKKAQSYKNDNNKRVNKTTLPMRKKTKEKLKNNNKKLDKQNFLKIVNNITNKKNINDKKYIHIDSIEINNIIKSNNNKVENNNKVDNDNNKDNINLDIDNKNGSNNFPNFNIANDELMKKIKNSLDDNLKVMLNFSYENFLSKESERE